LTPVLTNTVPGISGNHGLVTVAPVGKFAGSKVDETAGLAGVDGSVDAEAAELGGVTAEGADEAAAPDVPASVSLPSADGVAGALEAHPATPIPRMTATIAMLRCPGRRKVVVMSWTSGSSADQPATYRMEDERTLRATGAATRRDGAGRRVAPTTLTILSDLLDFAATIASR